MSVFIIVAFGVVALVLIILSVKVSLMSRIVDLYDRRVRELLHITRDGFREYEKRIAQLEHHIMLLEQTKVSRDDVPVTEVYHTTTAIPEDTVTKNFIKSNNL